MKISEKNRRLVEESLPHWLEIRMRLRKEKIVKDYFELYWNYISGKTVRCGCSSCELCKEYVRRGPCAGCPLDMAGMNCHADDSPYRAFINDPTWKTANGMVRALRSLLK